MSIPRTLIAAAISLIFVTSVGLERAWACHACGDVSACTSSCKWVEVEEEFVAKVPYTEEVERTVNVNVPHIEQVERTFTVMVPHSEIRKGTKTVRKSIPETKTVTVSRDFGRWETSVAEVAPPVQHCNSCCPICHCETACDCPVVPQKICERVWVPDVRTKDISVTTYRTVVEEVPYEYTVTVCQPEERTRLVDTVRYTTEERTQKMMVLRYREETRVRKVRVREPICGCCTAVSN